MGLDVVPWWLWRVRGFMARFGRRLRKLWRRDGLGG